jgi:hypothetical protein
MDHMKSGLEGNLGQKAQKAKLGAEPNPITVACAHAAYEAVRANNRFLGLQGGLTDTPFEKLTGKDRDAAISDAWDVMCGHGPEALYGKYDHEVVWAAADPAVQMNWVLFVQTCATQMKACFALAQGAQKAVEGNNDE